eukprot:TRINITY_DN2189_c0_g1_i1.p1 TRINITY_DN2189_c0_g1~~TRINITY_DN2189_c0_g1_i1.p1  ORF type:complete len:307 (+),score=72.51 TRINITY_DN2189_c0_g1_i1:87-1007(+)
MFGFNFNNYVRPFDETLRCRSVAFLGKPALENGGKIILPPNCLEHLSQLRIDYPMLFELSNPVTKRRTHCGVLEFTAEPGVCYIPYWMMQILLIEEGGFIKIKNVSLSNGTFVKFQPHTSNFSQIANPKAVLENLLRNFACLTKDDVICLNYNSKNFYLTVLETKPTNAISIVEADVNVDFAPPLDYQEPKKTPTQTTSASLPLHSTDHSNIHANKTASMPVLPAHATPSSYTPSVFIPEDDEEPPSFAPFQGGAQRLNGKVTPTNTTTTTTSSPTSAHPSASVPNLHKNKATPFVAFSGQGRSLK